MPRLPVLSGGEIIRGLERLGFQQVGRRGSHVKMRCGSATAIIPDHREVRKGTLASILQQAGVTIDDLATALKH